MNHLNDRILQNIGKVDDINDLSADIVNFEKKERVTRGLVCLNEPKKP